MKNKKGEMLIETVVSFMILVLTLAMVTQLLVVSRGIMQDSALRARGFLEEQLAAQKKEHRSNFTQTQVDIALSFRLPEGTQAASLEEVPLSLTHRGLVFVPSSTAP